ncbi:hypothetical protein HBNXHr_1327 [Halorhabdus sp. BNX81]|nr:hypothetical protein HBNXHr_1327 [Halorhabdus sp. BNX81]
MDCWLDGTDDLVEFLAALREHPREVVFLEDGTIRDHLPSCGLEGELKRGA